MKLRKKYINLSMVTNRAIWSKLSWPVTIDQISFWHEALYPRHNYSPLFGPLQIIC